MMDSSAARLTERFPSGTSIWSILRAFEAKSQQLGVAGIIITEVAVASTTAGTGRLFYAMPVVQIVGRELSTFEGLQLTLQSMGYNGGTALLRLKMKPTDTPYEEALVKIAEFAPAVSPLPESSTPASEQSPIPTPQPTEQQDDTAVKEESSLSGGSQEAMEVDAGPSEIMPTEATPSPEPSQPSTDPSQPRAVSVLAPAKGSVPEAAKCI